METQEVINSLKEIITLEIGTIVVGWILFVIGLVAKDVVTSFAFGVMFYLDPQFREGDTVYIDGDKAVIVKIGITITVFRMVDSCRWRYIKNSKIRYHKLEKEVEK